MKVEVTLTTGTIVTKETIDEDSKNVLSSLLGVCHRHIAEVKEHEHR